MHVKVVLLFFISVCKIVQTAHIYNQKEDGDLCIPENSQVQGICVPVEKCPKIQNVIKSRDIVTICGFKNSSTTVCCPIEDDTLGKKCRSGKSNIIGTCVPQHECSFYTEIKSKCNDKYVCCEKTIVASKYDEPYKLETTTMNVLKFTTLELGYTFAPIEKTSTTKDVPKYTLELIIQHNFSSVKETANTKEDVPRYTTLELLFQHNFPPKDHERTTPFYKYDETTRPTNQNSENDESVLKISLTKIRKSELKCQEYTSIVAKIGSSLCSKHAPNKYPHMASIGYGTKIHKSWNCGGSLISEKFILTAAHCLHSEILGFAKFIRLGDYNIASAEDDEFVQEFSVLRTVPHPGYHPPSKYNDIGLIEIDGVVRITQGVRPACLYQHDVVEQMVVTVTGWGSTDFNIPISNKLLEVVILATSREKCSDIYNKQSNYKFLMNGVHHDTQFCAGGFKNDEDTCNVDSGGPIQIADSENNCMFRIIGVTSFGNLCGIVNEPGLYSKVSAYLTWIEDIVWV